MGNENNPWLNITKYEEPLRPGLNGTVFSLKFKEEYFPPTFYQIKPVTKSDCYDPDDIDVAIDLIEKITVEGMNLYEFQKECFGWWANQESEEIFDFIIDHEPNVYELIDFLYGENYW